MEKGNKRFLEDVARYGKGSNGKKLKLARCCDMDVQLAKVATAKLGEIPVGLLDEIFQTVFFSDGIGMRRVCKGWNSAITRTSAPFVRSVVLSTDFFRSSRIRECGALWLSAKDASTLIICGKVDDSISAQSANWSNHIERLWESYKLQRESYNNDGFRQISKVIYACMVVDSAVFRIPYVLQVGFQTMIYRSTVKLRIGDFFVYDEDNDEDGLDININPATRLVLKVNGIDSYILKEGDLKEMNGDGDSPDDGVWYGPHIATSDHFARKNCTRLEDSQLVVLTGSTSLRDLGSATAVQNLVKQLIDSFDPGNKKALSLSNQGDVTGLVKAAHSLVSALLHRFVEFNNAWRVVNAEHRAKEDLFRVLLAGPAESSESDESEDSDDDDNDNSNWLRRMLAESDESDESNDDGSDDLRMAGLILLAGLDESDGDDDNDSSHSDGDSSDSD